MLIPAPLSTWGGEAEEPLPSTSPVPGLSSFISLNPHHQPIRRKSHTCNPHPSVKFSSVAQYCPTICDPIDCSTPGFLVHHQLPELAQTPVHRISDAIQPSHPLSSLSSSTFNFFQHQKFLIMSQLFASGGQSITASALVLPMNIQG